MGTESYVFEDMVFSCPEDLLRLLGSSLDDAHVGLYWDPVGVLAQLEERFGSGKEYTDKTYSADRCELTPLAADQMASMDHPTTSYFFEKTAGKKGVVEADDGWGHRMESYDRFTGAKGQVNPK